jgi:predicted alpha/beta-hydrolase family hydrolase
MPTILAPSGAMADDEVIEIATPHGPARAHVRRTDVEERAALLIGHGAGGGITAPDIVAAMGAALELGVSVARIEQPYRVAGRRSVAPTHQLDAAWLAVHAALTAQTVPAGLPSVAGGRSSGARVACRTATETGVAGVLCLAFPLHPPRRDPDAERKTRLPELQLVKVPVLIVQGERDPFGMPPAARRRKVVVVPGDHSLKSGVKQVGPAVGAWLRKVVA